MQHTKEPIPPPSVLSGLPQALPLRVVKLFISYSHIDKRLCDKLLTQLSSLKYLGVIETWHDGDIAPGGSWKKTIDENLETAHIVLFLVSADFLNSHYCCAIELPRALERHAQEGVIIIPVLLRPCVWRVTPLGSFQALPRSALSVTEWRNRDAAFADIAQGIWQVVEKLLQRPDQAALQAMMSVSSDRSVIPLEVKQLSSYYLTKSKPFIPALLIVCVAVLALWLWSRPTILKLESQDTVSRQSLVDYRSEDGNSVGWQPVPLQRGTNRLIKGEKLGLFKDEKARGDFNVYQDFVLELDVRFPASQGITWVARAKDFRDYYHFKLEPSTDNPRQGLFEASIYQNGALKKVFNKQVVYVDLSPPGEPVFIRMQVLKNEFSLCVASFRSTPNPQPLEKFYDLDQTYPDGGIGFAPRPGIETHLVRLYIKPDDQPAANLCQR